MLAPTSESARFQNFPWTSAEGCTCVAIRAQTIAGVLFRPCSSRVLAAATALVMLANGQLSGTGNTADQQLEVCIRQTQVAAAARADRC